MLTNIRFEGMEYHVLMYLEDIRARIRAVDAHADRVREAEADLVLHGVACSDMPGSPNAYGDAIPDGIIRLMERRQEHVDAIALHSHEIDGAWRICVGSGDENTRALWLHYVQGMTWGKVARALHYGVSKVYEMRVDGIVSLYCAMPEQWRETPV